MLNKSIPLLEEKNKTLETIKYGDKETAEIMKDILFRTNFTGMSVGLPILPPLWTSGSLSSPMLKKRERKKKCIQLPLIFQMQVNSFMGFYHGIVK